MDELTGLENEFTYDDYGDMLDDIYNNSGGGGDDYPNRPNTGSGDMVVDANGNPIDPNTPGVDHVANEYIAWLEEAAAYGVENLTIRDQILYAQAGYRAGVLTAEEAQAIYDPAFAQHAEDMGWEWDAERGQWKDPNLRDQADGEKGFVDYYTPIDFSNSNTGFDDFNGGWINQEWDSDREIVNTSFVSKYFKVALAIGASLISGGAASGALGGLSGWMSGAISSTIGSATGQLLVTGELDAGSLVQAALLGAVGGLFDDLSSMDGSIFSDATGLTGAADDAVTALSEMLNIPYDQALSIAKGVVEGTIQGGDLESIIANAAGSYTQDQIMGILQDVYGDEFNVQDWFKDGESNIPIEALEPFVEQIIDGVINGTIDDPGAWAQTIWDYFQAGGDIDFMLPDGVNIGEWFSGSFGCPEWAKTEQGNCIWDGISGWEGDVLECMPGWDWDAGLRQCLPIPNPCGEGLIWDADLGECLPDLPDVVECMEGWEWDDLLQECIQIDLPDVLECMPGFEWDEGLRQCLPIPNPCGEGLIWDADLGECLPDINIECPDNWDKDEDGVCIEPPMLCEEGYSWDVLRGCIPDKTFELPCPDGWDRDEDGVCIEPAQLCEPGYSWDILRGCIPDSEEPEDPDRDFDLETPDIDIDLDLPSFESGYDYEMGPRAHQYAYTPFKPAEIPGVREFEHILTNPLL